jgi:ATP-dependent protease ClpP protease subunit
MSAEQRRIKPYPAAAHAHARRGEGGDWEVAVSGDLNDKQNDLMTRLVETPRNSRGTIYFDSCGGSVYAGLGLATLIRLRGLKADGVVVGECSSAALLPFAACTRRFVTPHCTMLFHPIRWQSDEEVRFEEAEEWARHFRVLEQDLDQLLARFFGCEVHLLQKWSRPGRFVSGAELVAEGLAEMIDLFSGDFWRQARTLRGIEGGK